MIVYRELSSLVKDLGYSAKMMYSLSNTIPFHYREALIPKGNGEYRKLHVPDEELKALQRRISDVILSHMEISPYGTAYRPGGSPLVNAAPHVGHELLLKLDIRHFFDKITFALVRKFVFPQDVFSDANAMLLSNLCCYRDRLPQGAPSSPAISNIIMRDFDDTVGRWCNGNGIVYTRYCDDLTFSGSFDPAAVKGFVTCELRKMGFYLNEKKTVCVRDGQRMSVTGIVVNRKAGVASSYRRQIRQEVYYCEKFGVRDHLKRQGRDETESVYLSRLLGRINYVLSVDAHNLEFIGYRNRILAESYGEI